MRIKSFPGIQNNKFRSKIKKAAAERQNERLKVAEKIHSEILQELAICKFLITDCSDPGNSLDSCGKLIQQVAAAINKTIAATRNVVRVLLAEDDISSINSKQLDLIYKETKLLHGFELLVFGEFESLQNKTKIALIEIAKELIQNIIKHSGSKIAVIRLESEGEKNKILSVTDFGIGFDDQTQNTTSGGVGLFIVRKICKSIMADISITSTRKHGTSVRIELPHQK